jgi:hypothetical protein
MNGYDPQQTEKDATTSIPGTQDTLMELAHTQVFQSRKRPSQIRLVFC